MKHSKLIGLVFSHSLMQTAGFVMVALLAIGPCLAGTDKPPTNAGERTAVAFHELEVKFKDPDMIYAPAAVLFNSGGDAGGLANMAESLLRQRLNPGMVYQGFGGSFLPAATVTEAAGGYLCPTVPLEGGPADHVFRTAPPKKSLQWSVREFKANETPELPASFFTVAACVAENGGHIKSDTLRIIGAGEAFKWTVPAGTETWRVYGFTTYDSPFNLLHEMTPEIVEQQSGALVRQFGKYLGKTLPGVCWDAEGTYGSNLAWTDYLAKEYGRKKNRDIRLWMPLLIDEDAEGKWAKARWDWLDVVSDVYAHTWGVQSDWFKSKGMYFVSQLFEENIATQVTCVGDYFKLQRAVTMPGNDALHRKMMSVHDFKETQSVTEFEGRRFYSECLGAAGWDLTPVAMKQAANCGIAWGVSSFSLHYFIYPRNLGNVMFAPDWGSWNPWWAYFHNYTDFVRRASYINSCGNTVPDVLLLSPMDSAQALLGDDYFDPKKTGTYEGVVQNPGKLGKYGKQIFHMDTVYSRAMTDLTACRIEYLIADRHYMGQMMVDGGQLVRAPFSLKAVIMPEMMVLPLDVAEMIVAFARGGGNVYIIGDLPTGSSDEGLNDPRMKKLMDDLIRQKSVVRAANVPELARRKLPGMTSQVTIEGEVSEAVDQSRFKAPPMWQLHRRIDQRDFYWLVNNADTPLDHDLTVSNAEGLASIWDCETGAIAPLASESVNGGSRVHVLLKPCEAYWLVFDPQQKPMAPKQATPGKVEVLAEVKEPWTVRVDPAVQPEGAGVDRPPAWLLDGKGETRALTSWTEWGIPKFSGYVDYTSSFTLEKGGERILLDLGQTNWMAEAWVNGKSVGSRLWPPFEFDITDAIKLGANTLKVRVGNLLLNARMDGPNPSCLNGYQFTVYDQLWVWEQLELPFLDPAKWRFRLPYKQDYYLRSGLFGPVRIVTSGAAAR